MGAIHTAAAAVDTALTTLNTTVAMLIADVASARATAIAASIAAGTGPTGGQAMVARFEDPGSYVRAVAGQNSILVEILRGIEHQNTSATVAGQFLASD
jgi:hypothetical protein